MCKHWVTTSNNGGLSGLIGLFIAGWSNATADELLTSEELSIPGVWPVRAGSGAGKPASALSVAGLCARGWMVPSP